MAKLVSTLDVFHALSTVVAQYKGIARVVKTQLSDLELMRDCLAAEIDENRSLQEQLKKEREAHKKAKDLAAHNYEQLRKERDGLATLLALHQKTEKNKPNPLDTNRYPPMTGRSDAWIRNQERIMEKDKISMSGDTGNAWDKQVGGDHYKQYAIQPAQFALANGLDYAQSNAIKYIELLKQYYYKGE